MAKRLALRAKLRERQKGRCCYCGTVMTPPVMPTKKKKPPRTSETIEHLQRLVDGGTNRVDNIALSCHRCNSERGGMDWLTYASYRRGEFT